MKLYTLVFFCFLLFSNRSESSDKNDSFCNDSTAQNLMRDKIKLYCATDSSRKINENSGINPVTVNSSGGGIVCAAKIEVTDVVPSGTLCKNFLASQDSTFENPEKVCRDAYKEYASEKKDKDRDERTRLEDRIDKIQELERQAVDRERDLQNEVDAIEEQIADAEREYNEEIESIQTALEESKQNADEETSSLLEQFQDKLAEYQSKTTTERTAVINEFSLKSRELLNQCNLQASKQISDSLQARDQLVQARAGGAVRARSVGGSFSSVGDFDRIKKRVREELERCKAAKSDLEQQAKLTLDNLSLESQRTKASAEQIEQRRLKVLERLNSTNQRLGAKFQQAGKQYQMKMQRLQQKRAQAQQNFVQQKNLDSQQLMQLRNEQYGLAGTFPGASPLTGITPKENYDLILEDGIRDVCCGDDVGKRGAKSILTGAGNRSLNSICSKRPPRGSRTAQ